MATNNIDPKALTAKAADVKLQGASELRFFAGRTRRTMNRKTLQDVSRIAFRLAATYPSSNLGNPTNPIDDLIYIVLSGQTDESKYVGTFDRLKTAYPGWAGLSSASIDDIRQHIAGGGLDRQKASYIKEILLRIEQDFGSPTLEPLRSQSDSEVEAYLTSLPGIGIKTARCVMMYTLGRDAFPADVHCLRVLSRVGVLGWTEGDRAEDWANEAQDNVPVPIRHTLHVSLVQHGRAVCHAKRPSCDKCVLHDLCAYNVKKTPPRPTVVDLCSGVGGYSWGFLQAGYDVLLGVDVWQTSLDTYAMNIPGADTLPLDITSRDATDTIKAKLKGRAPSVVIAGTPCQGFSRAGPRDPNDERNSVLKSAIRVAVQLRPKVIVFENVANVRTDLFIHHLRSAEGVLRRAGYSFDHVVVDARGFGVAQSRQRLILVGVRDPQPMELEKCMYRLRSRSMVDGATVAAVLTGVDADQVDVRWNHDPMSHGAGVMDKIRGISPGTGPMSYRKLHPDKPAATLICGHRAMPCHYAAPRTITVREAARIQSFPDDFRFTGPRGHQMQQVANAVPPKLSLGVAMAMLKLAGFPSTTTAQKVAEAVLSRVHIRPSASALEAAPSASSGNATIGNWQCHLPIQA